MSRVLTWLGCLLLVTLGFGAADLADPPSAAACDCVGAADDVVYAEHADAVFVGRVVDTREPSQPVGPSKLTTYRLEVSAVYKGQVEINQPVVTFTASDCALALTGQGPYLIFARTQPWPYEPAVPAGHLLADLCGGSRLLAGDEPVPELGVPESVPTAPTAGTAPRRPELQVSARAVAVIDNRSWMPALMGTGAVVAVVGPLLLLRRRRARQPRPWAPLT